MADPVASHPLVLVATALLGAGAWKTIDRVVTAHLARQKQRRIAAGEKVTDPKDLQGWLLMEVRFLRDELASSRAEAKREQQALKDDYHARLGEAQAVINRQAAEHAECTRKLAAMQVEIDHLQASVTELKAESNDLRTELEETRAELADERKGRRRPKGAVA